MEKTSQTEPDTEERTEEITTTNPSSNNTATASETVSKPTSEATSSPKKESPPRKMKGLKKSPKPKRKSRQVESSTENNSSDSSDDDSDSVAEDTASDSSEDSDSETEGELKRRKVRERKARQKAKEKKKSKSKRKAKEDVSESDVEDDSEKEEESDAEADEDLSLDPQTQMLQIIQQQLQSLQQSLTLQTQIPAQQQQLNIRRSRRGNIAAARRNARLAEEASGKKQKKEKKEKRGRASKLEYKRVDQLWDTSIHNYKLTDTAEDEESSEYDQYLFNVRRTFDWEGKHKNTYVDIKSKLLKETLNEVMDGVKGVSLVEETPAVDPNILFLYLEDLRNSIKDLKTKIKSDKKMRKKLRSKNELKIKHVKVLVKYLDKDYAETKKTLYPMLESGLITFELLWALFKPGTLAYTTTYGTEDEPRAFKVDYAEKDFHFMKGEWYSIEGKYLEYDGKHWGMGSMDCDVGAFKGARKINTLNCYPLKYHKNEGKLRADLIERGKKFASLQGVHYKFHRGLAFTKTKKRQIIKCNVIGRIMVDPATHRRLLPNYHVSIVKPQELSDVGDSEDDDFRSGYSCGEEETEIDHGGEFENLDDGQHTKMKIVLDDKNKPHLVEVPVDEDGQEVKVSKLEEITSKESEPTKEEEKKALPVFTDEQYLIASPVVLGFAFSEKQWLEFTVSGVKEIEWNEHAYEALVLEKPDTKRIIKCLVEEHRSSATDSIEDVIQGKGQGLVMVFHGPPGTGKTLTAESISEHLKCPLYMVSAGELPTDSRNLEIELNRILEVAHTWGAVLLLDEADVFMEKRTIQDVHRNALVSVFLRLLEYFQGILILTTNRVETFDDAFQSRIHVPICFPPLKFDAKKSVFRTFVEKARIVLGLDKIPFNDSDYAMLARYDLNGREIMNNVRMALVLAQGESAPLDVQYIKRVIDLNLAFHSDFHGGLGPDQKSIYM